MMCMRVIRPMIEYFDNEFHLTPKAPEENIVSYNRSKKRFLFYPWALFITAYNRKALLLNAVKYCGKDYVYSDTDSAKLLNPERYIKHFEEYNNQVREEHYKCLDFYKLPHELIEPETIKGEKKLLGAFEYEHGAKPFELFKTLGAKRYMTYSEGKIELTVAGLGKDAGRHYIRTLGDTPEDWFNEFTNQFSVPSTDTGKLTHTYIDTEIRTTLTDMFGETVDIYEQSCIHLEPCGFTLSLSEQFIRFLMGYSEGYGLYGDD